MESRSDRPVGHPEDLGDLPERQTRVVVKDDDGPMLGREVGQCATELISKVGVGEGV